MAEQMQFSFDFDEARGYMASMFHLEGQRDELNTAINEIRTTAREAGVPTKAVEAAIKAAKGRRKSQLTPQEFQELVNAAEDMMCDMDASEEDPRVEARNRAVWDAAQGLRPEAAGPGVQSVTFSTEDKSVTIERNHHE
jgi:hypothetical protein